MNTLPQLKLLLIAALGEEKLTAEKAGKILEYTIRRNFTAYKSHSKRRR